MLPTGGIIFIISNHLVAHQNTKENMYTMNNDCRIILVNVGTDKMQAVKVLREAFNWGLKETLDIIDRLPYTTEETFSMERAELLVEQLMQAEISVKLEMNETNSAENISYKAPIIDTVVESVPNFVDSTVVNFVSHSEPSTIKRQKNTQELIAYYKDVFALESQLYTYDRIDDKYGQELAHVGVPQHLTLSFYDDFLKKIVPATSQNSSFIPVISGAYLKETKKPDWKVVTPPTGNTSYRANNSRGKALTILSIIFIAIIVLLRVFEISDIIGSCILLFIPYSICFFIVSHMFPAGPSYDNRSSLLSYYHKLAKEEAERIAESEQPLRRHIQIEREELVKKPRAEIKALLDKVYAENIIFPKYRNFAAVSQILEYLISGRCTELEGPNGAYNLYESELRQNIIINKLDIIIEQLDELNYRMGTICGAIQETNMLLGNISQTLGRIEANTALTAYNSQCVAHNTRIASQYVL